MAEREPTSWAFIGCIFSQLWPHTCARMLAPGSDAPPAGQGIGHGTPGKQNRRGIEAAPTDGKAKFKFDRDMVISAGLRLLPDLRSSPHAFLSHRGTSSLPHRAFSLTSHLTENWATIRGEAQALLRDRTSIPSIRELSADHKKKAVDDKWRSFFFLGLRPAGRSQLRTLSPNHPHARENSRSVERPIFRYSPGRAHTASYRSDQSHHHRPYGPDSTPQPTGLPYADRRSRSDLGRGSRRHL